MTAEDNIFSHHHPSYWQTVWCFPPPKYTYIYLSLPFPAIFPHSFQNHFSNIYDPIVPVHKLLALHNMVLANFHSPAPVTSPSPTSTILFLSLTAAQDFSLLPYLILNSHVSEPLLVWVSLLGILFFPSLPVGFLLIIKTLRWQFHSEAIFNLLSQFD